MVAPGAGFRSVTPFRSKTTWRPKKKKKKKRSSSSNYWVFGPEICEFQNKKKMSPLATPLAVADPENFGGGGFEAQNLKNSDVFTNIESDFSAELGNSNVFFAQIQVVSKKKKKKKRSSPKLRVNFRPKSEIQTFFSPKFRWSPKKKKKKGLNQNWDWFFAGFVTFRSVGGGCIPKWSRIIRNRGWFFGQNRYF